MMAADAGAAVLETNNDGPKIPDKKKTKFDVIIIGAGPSGYTACLLYTSPSPRDKRQSRMPSSA